MVGESGGRPASWICASIAHMRGHQCSQKTASLFSFFIGAVLCFIETACESAVFRFSSESRNAFPSSDNPDVCSAKPWKHLVSMSDGIGEHRQSLCMINVPLRKSIEEVTRKMCSAALVAAFANAFPCPLVKRAHTKDGDCCRIQRDVP